MTYLYKYAIIYIETRNTGQSPKRKGAVTMTKAQIMKRAHEIARTLEGNYRARMSIALRQAWAESRKPATLEDEAMARLEAIVAASASCYDYEIRFNLWENYGKSRTYIKVIEKSQNIKASKHYATYDFGYIDNIKNEYIPSKANDWRKPFNLNGARM